MGEFMKKLTLFLAAAALVLVYQNCSNVSFTPDDSMSLGSAGTGSSADSSGGDDSAQPVPTPPVLMPNGDMSEQFKVTFNSESAPLDMIWVIDNSGSMDEEAALVRKNFDAFLTTLNKSTNFRLLLVSQKGTNGTSVNIPSSFDATTHKQIDFYIGSNDGPDKLLAELKKLPAGFLRQNSKKIVVFVTDDNAFVLAANGFMTSLLSQQGWQAKDVSVSSFIGLGAAQSPCQAATGTDYMTYASQTGGRTYNICMQDWSANFGDLVMTSVSKAVRRFTLGAPSVTSIIEVKVDGVALPKTSYSLSGKVLTLADSVSLGENSMVAVTYR